MHKLHMALVLSAFSVVTGTCQYVLSRSAPHTLYFAPFFFTADPYTLLPGGPLALGQGPGAKPVGGRGGWGSGAQQRWWWRQQQQAEQRWLCCDLRVAPDSLAQLGEGVSGWQGCEPMVRALHVLERCGRERVREGKTEGVSANYEAVMGEALGPCSAPA